MNDEDVKLHAEGFPPLGAHGVGGNNMFVLCYLWFKIELSDVSVRFYFHVCLLAFQPQPAALPSSLAGWMANPSVVSHPSEVAKACLEFPSEKKLKVSYFVRCNMV
uniref:Uncharacterized protein n=1 Tax=Tanacetum cinerariifolium TaxID=118510 RepID=A0A6L2NI20_TANCI|nr:hypothetical protein [Tanacetum cinerariifolium]